MQYMANMKHNLPTLFQNLYKGGLNVKKMEHFYIGLYISVYRGTG